MSSNRLLRILSLRERKESTMDGWYICQKVRVSESESK
jgi:hypothetical protein